MSHLLLLRAARPTAARVLLASSPFAFFSTKTEPVEAPAARSPAAHATSSTKPTLTTSRATEAERALFKQVTFGSLMGLAGGLLFSKVSRIFVVIAGFGGLVLHTLGLRGIQILPVGWLGRRFKNVDWAGWVTKNPGFKISFSIALLATAFLREQ
ncbi:hypothetical protein BJ508DRAFT_304294 [Ascobolus immersus RN42]|uniref:FUN14-domain-containing protein n=1 Tax=Ascobolus immersus RN42 TaxID=1160509 RepID=A0A3N4ICE4_ASCIM|nr:hypothetical protein BJ508DRAFT_304294 [Ascobolus immersus RN42]